MLRRCLTRYFAVLVERHVVGERAIFANHHKLRRPLLTTPSAHTFHSDLPDLPVIRLLSPATLASFRSPQRPIHPNPLSLSTPDQSATPTAAHSLRLIKPSPSSPTQLQNDRTLATHRCYRCNLFLIS